MENIETLYPLSPMQQGILFHTLYAAPKSGMYFNQLSFTLHGDLNTTALQQAWQSVLERHTALRTAFQWKELEEPMQVVYKQVKLPWEQLDWRMLSSTEQQNKLECFLKTDYTKDFTLEQPPLMRCALIQLTDKSYHFVWTHHHLLIDGWCVPIIFKDVFAYYEANCQGVKLQLPPSRSYQKYIAWLQQQDMAEADEFWREKLKGVLAPTRLNLETAGTTASEEVFQTKKTLHLSAGTTEALQTLARQHNLTLNTLVQGAWALLLSRYSGEEDVVFGVTVSGRQMALPGLDSMVGLFINTLPVRVLLSGEETIIPWLQQLQAQQVEREPYSYTPLVDIHRCSDIPPGTPLFESIFVFENYPFDESLLKSNNQLTLSNFQNIEKTNYPIGIIGIPGPELSLTLIYDQSLFESSLIEGMLGHLQTLLENMVAHPQQRLVEIELLTESERHQLLVEWNQTQSPYPQDHCIHQLFEAQVDKTPEAIALVFEDQQLTYQALNTRANQLARYLQTLGVKPEVLVGLCVERSLEMMIGLLAILKAGGAYVPFDPRYPQERIAFMLEDSKVLLLLTQQKLTAHLPDSKAQVICLDNDWGMISKDNSENINSGVCSDNLAYVMYTSGSTGQPKGVSVIHKGVIRLVKNTNYVDLTDKEVFLQFAPLSFDASTFEIWGALLNGGRMVIMPPHHPSLQELGEAIVHYQVTTLWLTASLFHLMVDERLEDLKQVRQLLAGGDILSIIHVQKVLKNLKKCRLINGYGPTENTTFTCCFSIKEQFHSAISVPIGRPIANTQVYILDRHLRCVPIGVYGELYISGDGLAKGYLNRPKLTAEKFIDNPFFEFILNSNNQNSKIKNQTRLYKTGDLARYLPDGNIEFLGRIDNQIKLRGFRIELAEIESALNQHPNIRESVVIAREDQPGNKRLVAYLVSDLIPERIPYQMDCLLKRPDGNILKVRTEDISSGGVLLAETVLLEKDKAISLRLKLPGESEAIWLNGKIAWSQHPWAGIQFKLTSTEQTRLEKSITYLLEKQGLLKVLQRILTENLRNYLKEKLPEYMVPANFVLLNALPLTPNGKVDRRALPVPEMAYLPKEASLPQNQIEQMMALVWQEVLHLDKVGIHDNFFELGGHSLLLPQLQSKLQDKLGKEISMVELFEYPTIQTLAQHFTKTHQCVPAPVQEPRESRRHTRQAYSDIAIIGMAGRFPGAPDLDAFWQNLREGVESITFFSDEELISVGIDSATLNQPHYVKANGILSDVECFDAAFFDFSPREAEVMDPQHRLFLECTVEALDHAGLAPDTDKSSIGVYAGLGMNTYLFNNLSKNFEQLSESVGTYQLLIENDKDFLPSRTSYKLNLKGPSVNIQTACSTSLVAVHLACRSLQDGECDVALAGGVGIHVPQKTGYWYQEGMINSPDGHCRAFDAHAQGTVSSNGVGIVVLKRLEEAIADGDNIQAVIKGSAINNDGSSKVGYTAPSVEGQAAVIAEAQANADIDAESLSYIEAHGTGTALGDPIEIAALTKAFQESTQKKAFCAIGSVKTNIGHTDAASGVAGLIKTVLALKHRLLPASLHFEQANPQIDFANSPFYVNTTLSEWQPIDGMPRRAGVSSFGIGGTNAHLILEEAPIIEPSGESRAWQLLVLSAKTDSALEKKTANLADYIEQHPDKKLADVAYTLSTGRKAFKHRRMLVCQTAEEAGTALRTLDPSCVLSHFQEPQKRPIVFMFSGQGAQYVNMGWELYQTEPIFQEQVDKCSAYLKRFLGRDLRFVLYPELPYSPFSKGVKTVEKPISEQEATLLLNQTAIAQPALFVIEYALAQLWMAWGVHPDAMIGHSIGEYVAACLSEVFSLEEALSLIALRGKMMQEMPDGAMLSISLPEKAVQPLLSKGLSLAAINAPSICVVSGPIERIGVLESQLTEQGVACRRLHTSHAFHSDMMIPLLGTFTERVKQVELCAPKIPYLSNLTGTWINDDEATNPNYWGRHLRYTVRFAEGLQHLLQEPAHILLEIGPGRTLSTLARQHVDCQAEQVVLSSLRHPEQENVSDVAFLLKSLGQFWLAGGEVNWSRFYKQERRRRLALPSYPFERQRYWIDPPKQAKAPLSLWQSVVAAAQQEAQQGLSTLDNPIFLAKKSSLAHLCVAYMAKALTDLGAFNSPDEKYVLEALFKQFNVQPQYQQLLARWMSVLVEQGQLQQVSENFTHLEPITTKAFQALIKDAQEKWADEPHWLERVQRCGDKLAALLTGESQAAQVLFDQEIPTSTTDDSGINVLVQESPLMQYYNRIMQATVQQIIKLLPPSIKLNILEMGGGSGYATSVILPVLPAQQTRYTFTDISRLLVELAKQKFSAYPFVEYGLLDIEQSPQEQGYKSHRFDMVVVVNMLHVTRNIAETLNHVRSLLAPNGLLLIWEVTQPQLDFDITDALLMNPVEDGDRNQGNPFLSQEQWHEALLAQGFVEVAGFPKTDVIGHHILLAQADASGVGDQPAFSKLLDEQAEPIKTRPVSLGKQPDTADWFYMPSWKQKMLSTPLRELASENTTLVFHDEAVSLGKQLVQRLTHQGQDVISVTIGTSFTPLSENHYTLNPKQADDYEALVKALQARGKSFKTLVHFWTVTPDDKQTKSKLEGLEQAQTLGFYSLFFLAQAFGKQNVTDALDIVVVSNKMQPVTGQEMDLCPEKATLIGPIRVIPTEYPNIRCRSIDVVLPESGSLLEEKLIEQLRHELSSPSNDQMIAYRGHHRWVQSFEAFRLEAVGKTARLREGGVYLITGGLGGIGLVLAEHLAKTLAAKLILIGRSAFPVREAWSQWMATHDTENSISLKIQKIQALEELGAEVLVISADVSDLPKMQAVITEVVKRFGQIHGVIHAAGVSPGGTIQRKTPEQAESIFAPKVQGTLVLDAVLKDFKLDFFVLCSSLASILGHVGSVDHCAANSFIDAFAHYKTTQSNQLTISINWDGWQEVGQAAEAAKQEYDGRTLLSYTRQEKTVSHPLFDKCLIEGTEEHYITYHVQNYWLWDEHRILGQMTLPGTGYLEMARAAFEEHHPNLGTLEIREVYFLRPLSLNEDEDIEVRTILKPQEDGFEFVIVSQSDSNKAEWIEHARGEIISREAKISPTQYDIENIEASCREKEIIFSSTELENQERFVKVGPRWHNLKWLKFSEHEALGLLELPADYASDLDSFKLHPALLDNATGFAGAKNEGDFLPFSYKKLLIKGPLPAKIYSHITSDADNASQTDTLKFNITITDEQGTGLVEIEDYTLRRIAVEKLDKSFEESQLISENFYLDIVSPGLLESLTFMPATRQLPGPDEVEIEVYATGLNFKEVLIALGVIAVPNDMPVKFGYECVGKIVAIGEGVDGFQIGDVVIAFTPNGFGAFTTTLASSVIIKPDTLSFEEAATIPVAFGTAYYALIKLARLSQGERILIHAAAGGVGMAAVKIAQWMGAEIFATAGNPEKRAFLRSLGIAYVMDSRSLDFASEVMAYTEGKGVDVVLNSLGGEFISKSIETLAPFGRFVELGVRDIYNNTQLGLRPFEKGLAYFAVGAAQEIPHFHDQFREIVQHFNAAHFTPLPHQVFPITEVATAFEYMAKAKHIGKVVVSLQDKEAVLKQISQKATVDTAVRRIGQSVDLPNKAEPVKNIFYKNISEYLLPAEGVEVFRRILESQLPQVLVSTRDLQSRFEENQTETFISDMKADEQAALPKSVHPRPQLSHAYKAPRNAFEQKLANLWQEFMGIEQVGIHDDFFELGGDSLLAIQLIAQLRKTLEIELSPHSLLNSPTIASLAKLLEETLPDESLEATRQLLSSILVEMQTGNRLKPPLFLIHPIGGHVYFYHDLVSSLGTEQPVYGLQAPGLDGKTQPLSQVEEMASHYIEVLRVRQPEGPYFLTGASSGGIIAFEMAQQLQALGQEVALLAMVDSPGLSQIQTTPQNETESMIYLLRVNSETSVSFDDFKQLEADEQIAYFWKKSKMANSRLPDLDVSDIRNFLRVFQVNSQALSKYKTQVYPGKIIFFNAKEPHALFASNPEQHWVDLAANGLEVIDVSGNHLTMNVRPHVQVIADRLKAALEQKV